MTKVISYGLVGLIGVFVAFLCLTAGSTLFMS